MFGKATTGVEQVKVIERVVYRDRSSPGATMGILGSVFALLGAFTIGLLFLPFAALFSLLSLLRSISSPNALGLCMALVSILLTFVGFAMSPATIVVALAVLGRLMEGR